MYSRLSLSRLEDGELAIKVNLGCNYYYYYSRLSIAVIHSVKINTLYTLYWSWKLSKKTLF